MTPEQGQGVAKRMGAMYVECSSKEMQGVDEVFELAVDTAIGQEVEKQQQKDSQQKYGGGGKSKKSKKARNCPIL